MPKERLPKCLPSTLLRRLSLCAMLAASHAAWALDPERPMDFNIAAQPLGSALAALSSQAQLPLTYNGVDPGKRQAPALNGHYTPARALELLLSASGLSYQLTANSIVIGAASTTGAAAAASGAPTSLGEIMVTATKRSESQRKLPETVNVLKGKDLEDVGAREMEDFLKFVPGVTLQESDTNNSRTVSIRGVGPQPNGTLPGGNTTVGVLIDDVSMGDPYSSYLVPDLDPFDLNDLEVLKGPQGTLFGAAALNGALRYVLNKPLLGEWEAKGFVDWLDISRAGSAPTYGGAINLPIGSKLAFRAVDVVQELPGLYSDVNANGKNIKDADNGYKRMHRFMGLWQPTGQFSVNAFYLQQNNHRNDLSIANNLNGSFTRTDTPGPSSSSQDFAVANLDLRYNFDWATLISETSRNTKLQDTNVDASSGLEALAVQGIPSLRTNLLVNSKSISQEVRLVSAPGDSPWVWIGGAYYNRYKADVDDNILLASSAIVDTLLGSLGVPPPYPTVPEGGISVQRTQYLPLKAQETSLFGELTRKLGPASLTLGGRFYRETLSTDVQLGGLLAPASGAAGFGGEQSIKSEGFNPKVSATYQVTPDIFWYANASHGFQFGGLNVASAIPTDNTYPTSFKPSTIWSYESGVRTDAFNKKLQVDLTAFLLDWKDMQTPQSTADGIGQYTANVGRARSKGLESSVRWLTPIKGLILINSASYIHAKVAEPFTTSDGSFVPPGSDLPAAPRLQTATTLSYNTRLGPVRTGAALTFSHQGHAISSLQNGVDIYGYSTLDFNYNLSFPQVFLAPTFTLNATNLNNQRALIGGQVTSIGGVQEGELGSYLRPRAIALRISGHF